MPVYSTQRVFLGTDETIDIILYKDSDPVDLSGVTAVSVHLGPGVSVNSGDDPDVFDWDTGETGKMVMKLGLASIPVGVYSDVKLKTVTVSKPNGEVWPLAFQISVEDL